MKLFYCFMIFQALCFFRARPCDAKDTTAAVPQTFVRQVLFSGNKITKDFVIAREMNFAAGDYIPTNSLNEVIEINRERILNRKLFVSVLADIVYHQNDTVDIQYTVKELFYCQAYPFVSLADRNFNVWWYDYNHKFNRLNT